MTDDRIKVSLQELETHWSYDDAVKGHTVLDALEEAEAKAHQMARANRPG